MAYTFQDVRAGLPGMTVHDAPAAVETVGSTAVTNPLGQVPLGTIARATDPTYGSGEFIRLIGVASTAVGSIVTYDTATYQTALAPATANVSAPLAVAMSACSSTEHDWYQISGNAVCVKNGTVSLATRQAVGVQTAGILNSSITGQNVDGAVVQAAATTAATSVVVTINRPHMQGRGTT